MDYNYMVKLPILSIQQIQENIWIFDSIYHLIPIIFLCYSGSAHFFPIPIMVLGQFTQFHFIQCILHDTFIPNASFDLLYC